MKRAGQRNRVVTFERATFIDDGQGGQTQTWASIGQAIVSALPIGGVESLVAGTLQQQQPWRIEMPYRTDLTARDRITATWLPAGHCISIESVNDPDGNGRDMVILGTSGAI